MIVSDATNFGSGFFKICVVVDEGNNKKLLLSSLSNVDNGSEFNT